MPARNWLFVTAALTLAADQITKAIAVASMRDGSSVRVIDGVLHWTLQRNPGAAFGIFRRAPALFTVVAIVIASVIVWSSKNVRDQLQGVALGLVLGGAVGNLADRLFRPPGPFRGRVIDFIDFRVWPTFNFADSAVVIGALLIAIASFRSTPARSRGLPSE